VRRAARRAISGLEKSHELQFLSGSRIPLDTLNGCRGFEQAFMDKGYRSIRNIRAR